MFDYSSIIKTLTNTISQPLQLLHQLLLLFRRHPCKNTAPRHQSRQQLPIVLPHHTPHFPRHREPIIVEQTLRPCYFHHILVHGCSVGDCGRFQRFHADNARRIREDTRIVRQFVLCVREGEVELWGCTGVGVHGDDTLAGGYYVAVFGNA